MSIFNEKRWRQINIVICIYLYLIHISSNTYCNGVTPLIIKNKYLNFFMKTKKIDLIS